MLLRSAMFVGAHAALIAIILLLHVLDGGDPMHEAVRGGAVASTSNLALARR